MRTIDRIRHYIENRRALGELNPGDKLPSYHELMELGQGSYATVRNAMSKLEREGLIEIRNGNGTYLAGGNVLRIRLYINSRALPVAEMRTLLDRFLPQTNLNLELDIHNAEELCDPVHYQRVLESEQAVLTIAETGSAIHLPQTQLDHFDGYRELCEALQRIPGRSETVSLPFSTYTYQLGFSRELLRNIGFDPANITGNIDLWWDDYVARCRAAGLNPTAQFWPEGTTEGFMRLYGLLFSLTGYDRTRYTGKERLFATEAGHRLLQIVNDMFFYPYRPHSESFFSGRAGVSFTIGSWMTCQNQTARRPDIHVREFDAVPFEHRGRRIYPASVDSLECYLRGDLTLEKRKRTWEFMKLLLSREFQLAYSNQTGMISPRNDIQPQEYTWNTDRGRNSFCPRPGDLVIYEDQVFPEPVRAALSILLEDYKFYQADAATILNRMDAKKNAEAFSMPTLEYNKGE